MASASQITPKSNKNQAACDANTSLAAKANEGTSTPKKASDLVESQESAPVLKSKRGKSSGKQKAVVVSTDSNVPATTEDEINLIQDNPGAVETSDVQEMLVGGGELLNAIQPCAGSSDPANEDVIQMKARYEQERIQARDLYFTAKKELSAEFEIKRKKMLDDCKLRKKELDADLEQQYKKLTKEFNLQYQGINISYSETTREIAMRRKKDLGENLFFILWFFVFIL